MSELRAAQSDSRRPLRTLGVQAARRPPLARPARRPSRCRAACWSGVAVALAASLACTDALPCTNCPPLDGTFELWWESDAPVTGCPTKGPQPSSLHFNRSGSLVRTVLGGTELSGTVYDTWDFSLHGQTFDGHRYTLRGRAGLSSAPDGGAGSGLRLTGTLTTSSSRTDTGMAADAGASCQLTERFTAEKR